MGSYAYFRGLCRFATVTYTCTMSELFVIRVTDFGGCAQSFLSGLFEVGSKQSI